MDKSSKLGSYWASDGGGIYQLLLIAKDSRDRTIFILERCAKDGGEFRFGGLNACVVDAVGAAGLKPYTLPSKVEPGLVLAEDSSGVTRVFLAEHYVSDDELSLWVISDESVHGRMAYWVDKGYTDFRMAKTHGGDVLNVAAE